MNVWTDGCYDMVHYGHVNQMRQARSMGSKLIVGIHSDDEILKHKGPPVSFMDEREFMVRSIKWCDEIITNAPYITTVETLNKYKCDFCVHGDDVTLSVDGDDTYAAVKEAGRYKECKRTLTISTTDLIDRMLRYKEDFITEQVPRLINSIEYKQELLKLFERDSPSSTSSKKETPLCVFGIFDLFNAETVKFLLTMTKTYDFIICAVLNDEIAKAINGRYPIMDIYERCLSIKGCKFVDVVVFDPSLFVNFFTEHKINKIIGIDIDMKNYLQRYQFSDNNNLTVLDNPNLDFLCPEIIIKRVLDNLEEYKNRNAKKKINVLNNSNIL